MAKPKTKVTIASIRQRLKTFWITQRKRYADTPHRSFHITPRLKRRYPVVAVREGWQLIIESFQFTWQHRKPFMLLILLYSLVAYFLVGGVSQFDYVNFRQSAYEATQGDLDAISRGMSLFGTTLIGSLNQPPTELQQFLSGLVSILFLLIIVWLVRMYSAGKTAKIRDALYNGPAPLLSIVVVLAVMVLQLIPAGLAFFAFSVAVGEQWISSAAIGISFVVAGLLLSMLSIYWLTGSLLATMIVALPGAYPFKALAAARTLIVGRRWIMTVRMLSAAIIILLLWAVILFPIIMLEGWLRVDWLPLVPVTVQLLSAFSLMFSSIYLYKLYRSLL